jgi:hypothetical protein
VEISGKVSVFYGCIKKIKKMCCVCAGPFRVLGWRFQGKSLCFPLILNTPLVPSTSPERGREGEGGREREEDRENRERERTPEGQGERRNAHNACVKRDLVQR